MTTAPSVTTTSAGVDAQTGVADGPTLLTGPRIRAAMWGIAAAAAAGALIAFAVHVARAWPFTVDDSFITYRYSQNLAQGHGPIFNLGLGRAEGYTSFLWMLIMAVPQAIGLSPVLFAKVAGVTLTVGTMGVVVVLIDRNSLMLDRSARFAVAALSVLLVALFVPTAVHAVSGMETALYAFVVTLFLATLSCFSRLPQRWAAPALAIIGLLVGVTRPEGNLVVVVGLACLLCVVEPERRGRLLASAAILYVVPGLIYFVWRLAYYGHLFPLPFYVKVEAQGLLAGKSQVESFVGQLAWLLPLALLAAVRCWRALLPAVVAALSLLAFFLFPQHITGYEWRYLYPVFPFAVALAGIGLAQFLWWWSESGASVATRWIAAAAVAVLCGLTVHKMTFDTGGQLSLYHWVGVAPNRLRESLGRYLARFEPRSDRRVMVLRDVGAIPYYSGWRTIDTLGLNDSHIAIDGPDAAYALSYHPDLIILGTYPSLNYFFPGDRELLHRALLSGMQRVRTVQVTGSFQYWLLARPGSPIARYIQGWTPPPIGRRPRPAGDNPVLGG
jgi:arabinofuranosyltransferase